ncbi:MAG: hypothetical protein IPM93_09315 [Candidatus Obscuribacter sp.]|nr:hypothetical protein [Candidatus Obscuribacter sp.]
MHPDFKERKKTVRLAKRLTIHACESFLQELENCEDLISLKLPTRAEYMAAGGEASCAQAITTWAQLQNFRILETYAADETDEQLENLTRRLYGLVAALDCDVCLNRTGEQDLTGSLRQIALQRLAKLQGPDPRSGSRGPQLEIVCVDHLNRGTPFLLYRPTPEGGYRLRDRSDFRAVAKRLLQITVYGQFARTWSTQAEEAIGGMLYEVFRNTEEHAMADIKGDALTRSIRGLQARHHALSPESLKNVVGDFTPLANYCRRLQPNAGSTHVNIMELSVFDSGPGFAQSWTKQPLSELSLEQERQAVLECFSVGSSKAHRGFGQGLPHVVRLLIRTGGFLRLRTGRLSLFYDFAESPPCDNSDLELLSWVPENLDKVSAVSGSLVTLLVPLSR